MPESLLQNAVPAKGSWIGDDSTTTTFSRPAIEPAHDDSSIPLSLTDGETLYLLGVKSSYRWITESLQFAALYPSKQPDPVGFPAATCMLGRARCCREFRTLDEPTQLVYDKTLSN